MEQLEKLESVSNTLEASNLYFLGSLGEDNIIHRKKETVVCKFIEKRDCVIRILYDIYVQLTYFKC